MTPEEEKAAALEAVKTTAKAEAKAAMPALLAAGLGTDEAKAIIKGITEELIKTLKLDPIVKDFDETEKVLSEVIVSMQKQADEQAKALKTLQDQALNGQV